VVIESQKLNILIALTEHIKGVNFANGYEYDLTKAVFRNRLISGDELPDDAVTINEPPRSDSGIVAGEEGYNRSEEWQLLMQGWTLDDPENPGDNAYLLCAAIEHRLARIIAVNGGSGLPVYSGEYMLGNKFNISKFIYGPGIVRNPEQGPSKRAYFYIPLRITLATTAA